MSVADLRPALLFFLFVYIYFKYYLIAFHWKAKVLVLKPGTWFFFLSFFFCFFFISAIPCLNAEEIWAPDEEQQVEVAGSVCYNQLRLWKGRKKKECPVCVLQPSPISISARSHSAINNSRVCDVSNRSRLYWWTWTDEDDVGDAIRCSDYFP